MFILVSLISIGSVIYFTIQDRKVAKRQQPRR